jgi:hypothetical protein
MWSVNTRPKASVPSAGGCFGLLVLVIAIWVNGGPRTRGITAGYNTLPSPRVSCPLSEPISKRGGYCEGTDRFALQGGRTGWPVSPGWGPFSETSASDRPGKVGPAGAYLPGQTGPCICALSFAEPASGIIVRPGHKLLQQLRLIEPASARIRATSTWVVDRIATPLQGRSFAVTDLRPRHHGRAGATPHAVLRRLWRARRGGVVITGPILNARVRPRRVPLWRPEARE